MSYWKNAPILGSETGGKPMARMTAFEQEVERRYAAAIRKGGSITQLTPEQGRAVIIETLAKFEPDLYETHRQDILNRGS